MAQQVNTFTNGMNIDADINMISNNQYRYAQNIKISSDDSSTYGALTASEFIKRYGLLLPSNEIIIGTSVVNKIEKDMNLKDTSKIKYEENEIGEFYGSLYGQLGYEQNT